MCGSENKWQWSTEQSQLFQFPQVELRRNTSEHMSQQSSTWEKEGRLSYLLLLCAGCTDPERS